MKSPVYIIIIVISISLGCSKGEKLSVEKEKMAPQVNKTDNKSETISKKGVWKYYRLWDKKTNIFKDEIGDTVPSLYYKVRYEGEKPIIIISYDNKKEVLRLEFIYNTAGQIIEKILFTENPKLGKIKVLSKLNPIGYKEKEIIYQRSERGVKLIEKEFNKDESLTNLILYDEEERVKERASFNYGNSGKILLSKTVYSRDIKLVGSLDYYNELYKDYTEYYKNNGKVYKKDWYYKEEAPGSLYFTDKYVYLANGNTLVNSYDTKRKLIHKKEFNRVGDVIKSEFIN